MLCCALACCSAKLTEKPTLNGIRGGFETFCPEVEKLGLNMPGNINAKAYLRPSHPTASYSLLQPQVEEKHTSKACKLSARGDHKSG